MVEGRSRAPPSLRERPEIEPTGVKRQLGPMSALGHKQTFCDARTMSALPLKVDIHPHKWDVR